MSRYCAGTRMFRLLLYISVYSSVKFLFSVLCVVVEYLSSSVFSCCVRVPYCLVKDEYSFGRVVNDASGIGSVCSGCWYVSLEVSNVKGMKGIEEIVSLKVTVSFFSYSYSNYICCFFLDIK
ncbi:MAG: hypothetical protein UR73_C0023G0005 [candidate division WS6 bacterium GW2011_GWF1_35_23]|uniref:Uncharacterized protein n=1 Tax=candidate division WS6 bacterium GW2011_GWF1_35_23 TaxID=1619097 RepID=A0A0G0FCB5_9BACT|nr:MAG: hypothetical protein UR73_C0023G0005 [candidate division WS6 bacterium GW2011_GWF1_35_23]